MARFLRHPAGVLQSQSEQKAYLRAQNMPKIAIYKAFIFFMWVYDLNERRHLHITKNKTGFLNPAKIWLDDLEWFESGDLTLKERNEIKTVITNHQSLINQQITNFEAGKRPKLLRLK